jgi:predicted transposase/invertase (TIGR01784 family)
VELKPLSPRYDVVFKSIFGEKHISVLADFLKAVLDLPEDEYHEIRVVDPHLLRKRKDGKLGILDLRLKTKRDKHLHVELQVSPHSFIWKRIEYYNASLLTDQIAAGDDYGKLNRAISILISYPVLLEETKEFHTRFRLYDEKTRIVFPESSEIHILEVQKALGNENSPLANWLRFFAANTVEEFTMSAQTRPAIAEAWGVVQYLSGDEEARRLAEYEEMARRDEAARQKDAYGQGLLEGRQEGRQEEKLEIVRNALLEKMPMETIARLTGLSIEGITRIAAELAH